MPKHSSDFPERFVRTRGLYGPEGFAAIRRASVMVVGQGGVGAHAAAALARTGVGRLILVDFDTLSASSLNRFPAPVAEPEIGRPKVALMREFLARTCPDTDTVAHDGRFAPETAETIFALDPRFVIDAIDRIDDKILLLTECVRRGQPVVSSMGAAGKIDASRVRTADISETTVCPLAGRVRRALRKAGVESGVRCVYSLEKSVSRTKTGLPDSDSGLPSSIALPGIFGYALASEACNSLSGRR